MNVILATVAILATTPGMVAGAIFAYRTECRDRGIS